MSLSVITLTNKSLHPPVPDHVTPGAGDPGLRVSSVPDLKAHRAEAVVISLTKPKALGAAHTDIHFLICVRRLLICIENTNTTAHSEKVRGKETMIKIETFFRVVCDGIQQSMNIIMSSENSALLA